MHCPLLTFETSYKPGCTINIADPSFAQNVTNTKVNTEICTYYEEKTALKIDLVGIGYG